MKDAKGHGSNPRGAHAAGVDTVGRVPMTTWYHGSANEFSQFELGHGGPGSHNGVWLAQNPDLAKQYALISTRHANGQPATLYHATLQEGTKLAPQKEWDALEESMPGTRYSYDRDKRIIATLQSRGYHGLSASDMGGKKNAAVFIFDPSRVKIVKKETFK